MMMWHFLLCLFSPNFFFHSFIPFFIPSFPFSFLPSFLFHFFLRSFLCSFLPSFLFLFVVYFCFTSPWLRQWRHMKAKFFPRLYPLRSAIHECIDRPRWTRAVRRHAAWRRKHNKCCFHGYQRTGEMKHSMWLCDVVMQKSVCLSISWHIIE